MRSSRLCCPRRYEGTTVRRASHLAPSHNAQWVSLAQWRYVLYRVESGGERFQNRFERVVDKCTHFFVGPILNRMRDEDDGWVVAERAVLCVRSLTEFTRGDGDGHDAEIFQVPYVV